MVTIVIITVIVYKRKIYRNSTGSPRKRCCACMLRKCTSCFHNLIILVSTAQCLLYYFYAVCARCPMVMRVPVTLNNNARINPDVRSLLISLCWRGVESCLGFYGRGWKRSRGQQLSVLGIAQRLDCGRLGGLHYYFNLTGRN